MQNIDNIEFNQGAVRPMDCLREGWQLIKENYWLFFGITFVGVLLAGMAPMAILLGPMMCGIYMCLLNQEQGKKVSFETLFQGFNFFVPSLIATLIEIVPIIFLVVVWYIGIMVGTFAMVAANRQGPPPEGAMIAFFSIYFGGIFFLVLVSLVLKIFFMFTYLLIVEKNVSGWDAVRLSFRAGKANFWGILGVLILSVMLSMAGLLFCIVGAYLELPLSYAMYMIAYRQIFPHHDPFERFRDERDDDDGGDYDDDRPARLDDPVDTSVKVDPTS